MSKRTLSPNFNYEKELWKKGYCVVGVDEVGRGALSGPVYVGAVCFLPDIRREILAYYEALGIKDSKELTPKKREKISGLIKQKRLTYKITNSPVVIINRVGIVKATEMAMRRAILEIRKDLGIQNKLYILVDGFYIKYVRTVGIQNQLAIIKGDKKSIAIAAASILAKVERDRVMMKLSLKHREYGWGDNKGYGTKKHIEAIKKFGRTKLHRNLFLRKILGAILPVSAS